MNGDARCVVILVGLLLILLYSVHSSVNSLGKVNLWDKYKEKALKQEEMLNVTTSEYSIRKCCPHNEALNSEFKCVKASYKDAYPQSMIVDRYFQDVFIDPIELVFNKDVCPEKVIIIKNDLTLNMFLMPETGELLELDNKRENILTNYSTNYCVDAIDNERFALMTCLCKDKLCIQKCCPTNQYYSTIGNECLQTDHKLQLTLPISNTNYHLVHTSLNCSGEPHRLDNTTLVIKENGNLVYINRLEEEMVIPLNNYCIDLFLYYDQYLKLDGFYCDHLQHNRSTRATVYTLNKCCKEGESLNDLFDCTERASGELYWKPPKGFMRKKLNSLEFSHFNVSRNILAARLKQQEFVYRINQKKQEKLFIEDIIASYPQNLYCIDDYQAEDSKYAMIFAPCEQHLCLQKCCPYHNVYNPEIDKCNTNFTKSKNIINLAWIDGKRLPANYFFIPLMFQCKTRTSRLYPNNLGIDKLFLTSNGSVFKRRSKTKIVTTPPMRYCVDWFVEKSMAMVNGLFCDIYEMGKQQESGSVPVLCVPGTGRRAGIGSKMHFPITLFFAALLFQLTL